MASNVRESQAFCADEPFAPRVLLVGDNASAIAGNDDEAAGRFADATVSAELLSHLFGIRHVFRDASQVSEPRNGCGVGLRPHG
jgi:hypothetical protein